MTVCRPSLLLLFWSVVGGMAMRDPEKIVVNFLTADDDRFVVREVEITGENKVILDGKKATVEHVKKEYGVVW